MTDTQRTDSTIRWISPRWTPSRIGYRHLAGVTLVGTYLVMLLGAYTSAIGAGLSCPDWPTCYGT